MFLITTFVYYRVHKSCCSTGLYGFLRQCQRGWLDISKLMADWCLYISHWLLMAAAFLTHFTCCIFQPHSFLCPFPSFSGWQLKFSSSQWWAPLLCHWASFISSQQYQLFLCPLCWGYLAHGKTSIITTWHKVIQRTSHARAQAATSQSQHLDSLYCLGLFPKNIEERLGVKTL